MTDETAGSLQKRTALTVLLTTRNEEANLARSLGSVVRWADQVIVLDSESTDGTVEIAERMGATVERLAYEHGRIIPWIFQWALDNLPIRNEWILLLEADQAVSPLLRAEIEKLVVMAGEIRNGFYLRRRQIFRGRPLRFGGYGGKRMLKLFRRGHGELDPVEQDTRVYVKGPVGSLDGALEEWNVKEDEILFYLGKHLRYIEAFAQEELRRRQGAVFKGRARLFGTPDERILWQKGIWLRLPLFARPFAYFVWRYFFLFGFLDGSTGFLFHFLQAFWFRLCVDVRLAELVRAGRRNAESGAAR